MKEELTKNIAERKTLCIPENILRSFRIVRGENIQIPQTLTTPPTEFLKGIVLKCWSDDADGCRFL